MFDNLFKNRMFVLAAAMAGVGGLVTQARADLSYSTGFESPDFTVGPMSPGDPTPTQGGWSGGAQNEFTNNDHTVGNEDEAITTADAHGGSQSWRFSRGYNSPGQGTPFTPNLDVGVTNDGDVFTTSLWFKAVSSTEDDSILKIDTGTPDGTDRANYLAYLSNEAGGIHIYSFDQGSTFHQVDMFSGVSTTDWHHLDMSLTKNGFVDTVSVSLDGGSPVVYNAALNEFRQDNSQAYAESSRLKFQPGQDGDLDQLGFYVDDVSYSITPVPEPASLGLLSLSGAALLRRRRA